MCHLSGKIPTSLRSLIFLSFFNVPYDNLEGPIPTTTQFQGFNASAFWGNQKLCCAPLPNGAWELMGLMQVIRIIKMWTTGMKSHGFTFPLHLDSMLKTTWRYAYFQFLDNAQDTFYGMFIFYTSVFFPL